MGVFRVACRIENQRDRTRTVRVPDVMVDTGSELTWIGAGHLAKIGVEAEKRDRRFALADGREITRSIGFAVIRVGEELTTDEVVFARPGDLQLLGARTLDGLNVKVDSRGRRLVAAGPVVAAAGATVVRRPDRPRPTRNVDPGAARSSDR